MNLLVEGFEWDPAHRPEGNVRHIANHNVFPDEVEEIFEFPEEVFLRKTRQGYRLAYGRSNAGRYLLVVFLIKPGNIIRVITARDMNRRERRYYQLKIE